LRSSLTASTASKKKKKKTTEPARISDSRFPTPEDVEHVASLAAVTFRLEFRFSRCDDAADPDCSGDRNATQSVHRFKAD